MRRRDLIAGSLLTSLAFASSVRAQAWPARDITIIVAVGPGSSADAVARGVARVASRASSGRRRAGPKTCWAAQTNRLRRARSEQARRLHPGWSMSAACWSSRTS